MPVTASVDVRIVDNDGHETRATLEMKTLTKLDARAKAIQWGGAVLAVGLVMVPIPFIHFLSGDHWPAHGVCLRCRAPYVVSRAN